MSPTPHSPLLYCFGATISRYLDGAGREKNESSTIDQISGHPSTQRPTIRILRAVQLSTHCTTSSAHNPDHAKNCATRIPSGAIISRHHHKTERFATTEIQPVYRAPSGRIIKSMLSYIQHKHRFFGRLSNFIKCFCNAQ